MTGGTWQQTYSSAFLRCAFDFSRAGESDAFSNGSVWVAYDGLLLESCIVRTNMDELTNNSRFFWSRVDNAPTPSLTVYANTWYNDGVEDETVERHGWLKTDATGAYRLYGNVFVHADGANQFCLDSTGSTGFETTNWDCLGNLYYGFEYPGSYGQGAAYDQQSEWEAAIDQAAFGTLYQADPEFHFPPRCLWPLSGGLLDTVKNILPELQGLRGMLGRPYSGTYGAYQGPPPRISGGR